MQMSRNERRAQEKRPLFQVKVNTPTGLLAVGHKYSEKEAALQVCEAVAGWMIRSKERDWTDPHVVQVR